ncbi:MAG TPA: ATP synthase F1 subunit delta [Vicinamibacterales bacterium]
MTSRAAGVRYARALFDVVMKERGDIDQIGRDLTGFAQLVAGNEGLARVLSNPAIPTARKRGVVEQLLAHSPAMSPVLKKTLLLLADRDRLRILPDVAAGYRDRLMQHANVVRAEVVTAAPLPADRLTALKDGLARATGRQVQLESRVDPKLIGGAVTRVGSTVFDGSIATQLQKLKQELVSAE